MEQVLPAPLLSSLSDMLAERIGLHFPANRWADLERGITAAAPALGMLDARSCALRLLSAPLTHSEIEILASFLTIGETYFFREKRSFEVLEQHILPPLLRSREASERRLRIWSAGCCTGEEAYSIAMLLDRLIMKVENWNITLLATDINPVFLRKAVDAEYGEWSFRTTPDWIKQRYFRPWLGGRFKLDERIRKRVTFSHLNLADDIYPSLTNNSNAMDIIFCRNVLMYFSAKQAQVVIENLYDALVEGGWLIVSPAETSSKLFSRFTTVEFEGAILYRKNTGAQAPHFVSHKHSPDMGLIPAFWHLAEENISVAKKSPSPLPTTSTDTDFQHNGEPILPRLDQMIRAARDCANQGRLSEATEWCRKAIAADKLNPAHHYLLAVIQQEQGQNEDAAQSLLRTLYIDPDFVLANYALGNMCQSQGRAREAQRYFDIALAWLRAHPPNEILLESDGLTAGRLAEVIASMQARMPQRHRHL